MSAQQVSFTVRRPSPVSRAASSGPDSDSGSSFKVPSLPRHLTNDSAAGSPLARSGTSSPYYSNNQDSDSDQDDEAQDELVTGFDKFGVRRLHERKKPEGPLVIPSLKNRDWREAARKRRGQYVPESARAQTVGADGSVGGLGTRDSINSGPVVSGLQLRKKENLSVKQEEDVEMVAVVEQEAVEQPKEELDDDKLALRALLSGADGNDSSGPQIDIIPTPISETDAYKQDVAELPESATLADYERIPVSQFGAAMLRGMGWKEGTAASRNGRGIVQPHVPEARPALLGIGAKEMETFDDGSKKNGSNRRPEKRYVPVVKKDRDGNVISESDSRKRDSEKRRQRERSSSPRRESRVSSRRSSPDRRFYDDRDRRRESSLRNDDDREREKKDRTRHKARDRDDDRAGSRRERSDRDRDRDREYRRERSRESERRKR